jgi:hypothetical protein
MSDLLAKYRRQAASAPEATTPPKEAEEYAAFAAQDRVERLKVKRANEPTRAPGYDYLLDIVYDGDYGTNFVLTYTFLMVLVRGKNLQPVILALLSGTADYIQEFDPERWPKPLDAKTPVIESIEVVVQEGNLPASQSQPQSQ